METWPEDAPVFGLSEMATRCQDSALWRDLRRSRITSTNVKNVCTSTDFTQTAHNILNPADLSKNPFVLRGKQDEEKGAQYLIQDLSSKNVITEIVLIGFITHPTFEWLGASPDRLLKVNNEWFLVEIKNWYETVRQKSIKDLKYLDKNGQLRHSHSYYYQIQTALLVSGMKKCYFVVHGKECSIEIIEYNETFCNKMLEKLTCFYETHFKTATKIS